MSQCPWLMSMLSTVLRNIPLLLLDWERGVEGMDEEGGAEGGDG